jgi:uncharacterized membrane protein YqaE (UPF0057 family)
VRAVFQISSLVTHYLPPALKSLRYFFCVAFPPIAVLMTGRILSFILSLLLTLAGWVPGVIHACLVVNDYQAEHRR